MSPQRRTALVSVAAAVGLVVLKAVTGLLTGSLGLLSEALHSATDLVAALLTFFAVGVSGRPADPDHPYGHGKAEHLAAMTEAAILVVASLVIAGVALAHLAGVLEPAVDSAPFALVVIGIVIAIDAGRTVVSRRAARRYSSAALSSNALHFGSDLVGSVAVLGGLLLAAAGYPRADSAAALFVAALVLLAAGRLLRRNVDVLMDRAPAAADEAARRAILDLRPPVDLRRLRLRQVAGGHFADVVIRVPPDAAVGQGHAAADAVEAAAQCVLPASDIVVHVEPGVEDAAIRERAHASALAVPQVREVHNVKVIDLDGRTELSLHLKLPGAVPLEEAHEVANEVERAILAAVPELDAVQTHLEPLGETGLGTRPGDVEVERDRVLVNETVWEVTGHPPRALRFVHTDEGLVAFLTLGLDGGADLREAHRRASEVEARIRMRRPGIVDVVVHTEP